MVYADYTYYTEVYMGHEIAKEDFPRLSQRASEWIDQLTFGRAAGVTEENLLTAVQSACCAAAEAVQQNEASQKAGVVSSERVGDQSVTYARVSAGEAQGSVTRAVSRYLANTGLMYAGVMVLC